MGIDTNAILSAVNLNTLGMEIDRVLEQVGLELRQGDVYLNRLGAEQLNAQPGDVLDIFIGPIPVPFRVRAVVEQAGPLGALKPVVMLRLDEAQELLFMPGRVNNVLVSNTGDAYTGMANTAAAARQLRALALNEAALTELVALLREPDVLAAIEAGADGSAPSTLSREEEDMADFWPLSAGGGGWVTWPWPSARLAWSRNWRALASPRSCGCSWPSRTCRIGCADCPFRVRPASS
ncbi:hypothetical protein [Candidatus Amarolinea dominans]|uniref:hypothetical protein n=1 Tax=Candidatus Amarolinea dominans TaxID=3140696 RepID=UPI003134D921|nr:hypothetical protein [Anaerolineae bacterium]